MRNSYTKLILCLALSLVSSTWAFDYTAQNHTATLDNVKQNSINFLNNHNDKYNLYDTKLNNSDIQIKIGSDTYYFAPNEQLSDEDKVNLNNLINTGSSSLVKTTSEDNYIFAILDNDNPENNKYYKYDTTKLPTSSYSISTGTSEDYTFKIDVPDEEGELQTKYFKVNTTKSALSKITSVFSSKVPTLDKLHEQDNTKPQSSFQYTNLANNSTNVELKTNQLANHVGTTITNGDSNNITVNLPKANKFGQVI